VVVVASVVGACSVVALYSFGLTLVGTTNIVRRGLGRACFVLAALVVLYGVYLVIPYFHR